MNVNKECRDCAHHVRLVGDLTQRLYTLIHDVEETSSALINDRRSTTARIHGARLYKAAFRAVTDSQGEVE